MRGLAIGSGIALGVIVVAITGITPADSQELAPFHFAWEINFTTLGIVIAAAFTWRITVIRQGDKVAAHARTIAELKIELASKVEADALKKVYEDIESLTYKNAKIELEHNSLKDEVYKEYLNARAVREIKQEIRDDAEASEKRLMGAMKTLSDRFEGDLNHLSDRIDEALGRKR